MGSEQDGRDRAVAWAAVVALQGLVAVWLLRDGVPPDDQMQADDALQIEFISRSTPTMVTAVAPASRTHSRETSATHRAAGIPVDVSRRRPQAQRQAVDDAVGAAPATFDLRVPEAAVVVAHADPLQRRAALDHRATRFESSWAPSGNVLDAAAFRSRAAALALHAFGGPPRHCDEIERRRRVANCLPLGGEEAEDERLRRSLDAR